MSHLCECLVGPLDTAYKPSAVVYLRDKPEDIKPCGVPTDQFTDYGNPDGRVYQCAAHHARANMQVGLNVKREFRGLDATGPR